MKTVSSWFQCILIIICASYTLVVSGTEKECLADEQQQLVEPRSDTEVNHQLLLQDCLDNDYSMLYRLDHVGEPQSLGVGEIPPAISLEVRKVVCETHLYALASLPTYHRMPAGGCINHNAMCAYWKHRGQCENGEYRTYMHQHCTLVCQVCLTNDIWRARTFMHYLLTNLAREYDATKNVTVNRMAVLTTLLQDLDMDPAVLTQQPQSLESNWFLEIHRRLDSLIPKALSKAYSDDDKFVDDTDVKFLQELHQLPLGTSKSQIMSQTTALYRNRGIRIVSLLHDDLDTGITRSLQLLVAFAIPNDIALQSIKALNLPILQMGAGSGYWAAMLQKQGIEIVAYDLHPPKKGMNVFFDHQYHHTIIKASCANVLHYDDLLASSHALLLVWPNDPDPVDNRQFCAGGTCDGSQPVWDAHCLQLYLKRGGTTVIFVGERGSSNDWGMSATKKFQEMLLDKMELIQTVQLPQLWLNDDDLTIWKVKSN